MADFRSALSSGEFIFFDGAMGTMLQARGLTAGVSPEVWCMSNPEVLQGVHCDYARAGATVLTTNTFGGTSFKLPEGMDVVGFNREMAAAAKRAAVESGREVYVAGSVGPTGHFLRPLGDLEFSELVDAYKDQITGLVEGGIDLVICETHFDVAELRAAVVAVREVCDLPVGASMTFENGMSLTGSSPEVFVETMLNMGVDFVATNCSAGPEQMVSVVQEMLDYSTVPVLVMPNAGLPELDEDGSTVFRLDPESFATQTKVFAEMGARCLGGCCGTTPEHISALAAAVADLTAKPVLRETDCFCLTSRSQAVRFGITSPTRIIGERINPTGKKQLIAELQSGQLTSALMFAQEQLDCGAPVLDVNVGAPMVDETEILPELLGKLVSQFPVPLSIDSSNMDAVEAALKVYPASSLVNSISGEEGRLDRLGPLCKKYGAPFIMLPLTGSKLPVAAKDRIAIIDDMLEKIDALDIPRRLVIVDVLALAVSSKPEAALACLDTVEYCTKLGLPTTIGLSNISFGLPARPLLNGTFLAMAVAKGLSSCIAHPGNPQICETLAAAEVLMGRDENAASFIAGFTEWKSGAGTVVAGGSVSSSAATTVFDAVVKGDKDAVIGLIKKELENNIEPFEVVNGMLIPAITEVGMKYERKEYFLPQLLRSAETMQHGFSLLRPLLEKDAAATVRPKVIMATVEGDIHDIGKNIVCLMLGNHGFDVVDLGKDVKAETIVDAAEEHGAKIIGLSALMTTTMVRMEDTLELLKERGMDDVKVMIGGAVVTAAFADTIGAHGYSEDAVSAVRVAQSFLEES
ncbi:homocysteine S-methyltransferase family protein [Halodesulfovibrio sp.]|uniref:homocysteine S-methyltransferase family protein n=1 Tax=Halodesulfovibrio sp. TaxID=1912772 RepID=UPI0025F9C5FE|nr:homocysteine S-methyltransferase family protein [Halodesulfovibrio sp.]MCT4627764.1 homocysteine S-methyltransferase family protein [Halodesulfovibrio sp.]